jgi:hypothetical protein
MDAFSRKPAPRVLATWSSNVQDMLKASDDPKAPDEDWDLNPNALSLMTENPAAPSPNPSFKPKGQSSKLPDP